MMRLSCGFQELSAERAFASSRRPRLIQSLNACAALVCILLPLDLICYSHLWRLKDAAEQRAVYEVALRAYASSGTVFVCMILVLKTNKVVDLMGHVFLECTVVVVVWLLLMTIVCTDRYYLSLLCGYNPLQVWQQQSIHSSSRFLLLLDSVVMLVHLTVPIRWQVSLLIDITSVLYCIGIIYVLGTPDNDRAWYHVLVLASVLGLASLGARQVEMQERIFFSKLMEANSLRLEAQNRLSMLHTEMESLRTLKGTGSVYGERRLDVTSLVARIVEIGQQEQWLIKSRDLTLEAEQVIGIGTSSVVIAGRFQGVPVAVRVPRKPVPDADLWTALPRLGQELRSLRQVRHPNIALFHGACIDLAAGDTSLVLEMVSGEPLTSFMQTAPTTAKRKNLIVGICRAVRYLHACSPCIVHGSIRAASCVVQEVGHKAQLKLLGYGHLQTFKQHWEKAQNEKLRWLAPELILSMTPTESSASDVYSVGLLVYYIAVATEPLARMSNDVIKKMAKLKQQIPLAWPVHSDFCRNCQRVTDLCSHVDPSFRPSMLEVSIDIEKWNDLGDSFIMFALPSPDDTLAFPGDLNVAFRRAREAIPLQPKQSKIKRHQQKNDSKKWVKSELSLTAEPPLPTIHETNPEPTSLVHPDLNETPRSTEAITLLQVMPTWNFPLKSACCSFHAALIELQAVHNFLEKQQCRRFIHSIQVQCCQCWAVGTRCDANDGDSVCELCGSRSFYDASKQRDPSCTPGCVCGTESCGSNKTSEGHSCEKHPGKSTTRAVRGVRSLAL